MNNWHIKIADCTEAQKEVLKRVYGDLPININTYLGLHNGIVIGVFDPDGMGELITPDEAFKRLGLTAKPLSIDWTLVESFCTLLVQDKETGRMKFMNEAIYSDYKERYHLIATRPKPKYTPEQIEAAKAYDEWLDLNNGDFESDCFEAWLKEVGNETK